MAEIAKKVNTIKSIGKKVADNGDANDYVYIPIGTDSDYVDRPDGSTVEESLENIETEKVEFIPVETLPTENIKIYPFIYALVNTSAKRGVFYEYKNNIWIKYGNSSDGIWVGTREECLAALKKNEIEKGTIVFVIKKTENSEDVHKHDYVCQITKEPTYSETGTKLYTCLLCLESYEEEIPALIDSINPSGVIRIGNNEYCTWKDTISFNTYYNEIQTVTIEATDNETGVKEIAYYLADTASSESDLATVTWITYTDPFEIEPNNNYVVYARIKDNADNVTYICSDGIVLDNIAPVFDGLEDGGTYPEGTVITVGEGETLTVNGEVVELVDNTYTLDTADNYLLSLTDRTGNSSTINIIIEVHNHTFIDGVCTGCGCSESLINNWDYIIDEKANTVQLTNYKGESNDVIVDGVYKINRKNYNTILNSHHGGNFDHNSPFKNKSASIKTVTVNNGVLSYDTSGLFYNCTNVTQLNLLGLDVSNVTNMNYMFCECNSLVTLKMNNFDMSNVETMKYIFLGVAMQTIDLSAMDLHNVTNTDSAFAWCDKTSKFILPCSLSILGEECFMYTSLCNIGEIGSNFSLKIPTSVKVLGDACFSNCESLETVTIPEGVEQIGNQILRDSRNVTTLSIPSTINNVNSENGIFGSDRQYGETVQNNLKHVYYNTEVGEGILRNSGSNEGCVVQFGENVKNLPNILNYNNNGSGTKYPSKVSKIIILGEIDSIPDYFANKETYLQSVILPNSIKTIGTFAFSNCTNLEITIPNEVIEIADLAFNNVPQIYYNGSATGSPWGALKVN